MYIPHSLLEWCQQKVSEVGKIKKSKIELKKETMCQNNYSGLVAVVWKWKIDVDLLESSKDNDLGLRYFSNSSLC